VVDMHLAILDAAARAQATKKLVIGGVLGLLGGLFQLVAWTSKGSIGELAALALVTGVLTFGPAAFFAWQIARTRRLLPLLRTRPRALTSLALAGGPIPKLVLGFDAGRVTLPLPRRAGETMFRELGAEFSWAVGAPAAAVPVRSPPPPTAPTIVGEPRAARAWKGPSGSWTVAFDRPTGLDELPAHMVGSGELGVDERGLRLRGSRGRPLAALVATITIALVALVGAAILITAFDDGSSAFMRAAGKLGAALVIGVALVAYQKLVAKLRGRPLDVVVPYDRVRLVEAADRFVVLRVGTPELAGDLIAHFNEPSASSTLAAALTPA
jgi:hypothetical protein